MVIRRWDFAVVTLAAIAIMTALSADAAPRKGKARSAQPAEATAPREAGELIMAIVSINKVLDGAGIAGTAFQITNNTNGLDG